MVLLTDIKGKKRKTTKADLQKLENYKKLPGVYTIVREFYKNTLEGKIPWKQQKGL